MAQFFSIVTKNRHHNIFSTVHPGTNNIKLKPFRPVTKHLAGPHPARPCIGNCLYVQHYFSTLPTGHVHMHGDFQGGSICKIGRWIQLGPTKHDPLSPPPPKKKNMGFWPRRLLKKILKKSLRAKILRKMQVAQLFIFTHTV